MPKARARRATAVPIRPMPMMPSRLPQMRWPSIQVGDQPLPFSVLEDFQAFGEPARHRQDQRHGHVGGVFGQHAGRIGDGDAALMRGRHVDIVDAVAEIGDQLEPLAGLIDHLGVDLVGDGRHQHVGALRRLDEFGLASSDGRRALSSTSNSSRMRVSTLSGSLRVTTTRGFFRFAMFRRHSNRSSRACKPSGDASTIVLRCRAVQGSLTGIADIRHASAWFLSS